MTKLQTNIDIANLLTDAGFDFQQQPNFASVQPDFLVTTPNSSIFPNVANTASLMRP